MLNVCYEQQLVQGTEEDRRWSNATAQIAVAAMPPTAWTHHGSSVHRYSQTWAVRHAMLAKAYNNEQSKSLFDSCSRGGMENLRSACESSRSMCARNVTFVEGYVGRSTKVKC